MESPNPAGSECLGSPLYSICLSPLLASPDRTWWAPEQNPNYSLSPIGGALPESCQSKGPMWGEAHGPMGGKRHVLRLQSSSQEAIQEDTEVGTILGPASFWKGSWRRICEGAARLLLILNS